MIFAKSASRYSGVRPRVAAMAFIRSTSKPMILPPSSLNSLGAYGMFTPTINFPEDLMSSGTVLAIASTLLAFAAVVLLDGPALSVLEEHPVMTSAPVAAKTAAKRHIFPPDTSSLLSASGRSRSPSRGRRRPWTQHALPVREH